MIQTDKRKGLQKTYINIYNGLPQNAQIFCYV